MMEQQYAKRQEVAEVKTEESPKEMEVPQNTAEESKQESKNINVNQDWEKERRQRIDAEAQLQKEIEKQQNAILAYLKDIQGLKVENEKLKVQINSHEQKQAADSNEKL